MHRCLRFPQVKPWSTGRYLIMSSVGPVITGPGRTQETLLNSDMTRAFSTLWPLGDGRILCATGIKDRLPPHPHTNLGLAVIDPSVQATNGVNPITMLYDDPQQADFEARPLAPRPLPPVLATAPPSQSFTATLIC